MNAGHAAGRWGLLIALSAALLAGADRIGLPAAALLGPLVAGATLRILGMELRIPEALNLSAQAMVGCVIGGAITVASLSAAAARLPLLATAVAGMILVTTALGVLASRHGALPGSTALWGLSPGAAAVMVIMARAFGADARLVAFMQYLRVAAVAITAAFISWLTLGAAPSMPGAGPGIAPLDPAAVASTLAVAAVGAWIALRWKIPAGVMLVPMSLAVGLQATRLAAIEVPAWLQTASFAVLGWHIGLPFTRQFCVHALRLLHRMVLLVALLMAACAAFAAALVWLLGVDPLTAFLATAPGGLDSVAAVAAATPVDLAFVMGFQTVRLLLVLATAPRLARLCERWSRPVTPPAR